MRNLFFFLSFFYVFSSCSEHHQAPEYKNAEFIKGFPFTTPDVKKYESLKLDSNGIPLLTYKDKNYSYPITYCQAALCYYENYLKTKNIESLNKFLRIADYVKKNIVVKNDFAVLTTEVKVDGYHLKSPWASAMAQGYALGITLQAYKITEDKKYLELSEKILNSFKHPIEEGGVASDWNGVTFYEEYADPKSHVLNGFIFSLSGLYYYYKNTGNEEAKELFDQGTHSLKLKLKEYDAGFTSKYSQVTTGKDKIIAYASAINDDPDHYHELVIYQLLTLYHWTDENTFKNYADLFLKYDTGLVNDFYNQTKFKTITASNSIDSKNYGINHLDDELWSWGKYWSTNTEGTTLTINFQKEETHISDIVFYAINDNTLPTTYSVFIKKDNDWTKVSENSTMKFGKLNYYKTGSYESYIRKDSFKTVIPKTDAIKIVFTGFGSSGLLALREINVLYNVDQKLAAILNMVIKNETY